MKTLCKLSCRIVLAMAVLCSGQLCGQELLTVGAITLAAKETLKDLQDVAASATGDVLIATNQAAAQVSNMLTRFDTITSTNVTAPLNSLGYDAQALGNKLVAAIHSIDATLSQQRTCGYTNAAALIARLQNAAQHLASQIPLSEPDTPYVYSFHFAGHDPDVVPQEGGQVTLQGYRLWINKQPDVVLKDSTAHSLTSLQPSRAGSDDSISVIVGHDIVAGQIGKTLNVELTTHNVTRPWYYLWIVSLDDIHTISLPMAISQQYGLTYRVGATITYRCSGQKYVELGSQEFRFVNPSCENAEPVNDQKMWQVPAGGSITSWRTDGQIDQNNNPTIVLSVGSSWISAAGSLPSATCFLSKLWNDTHWIAKVVPTVSYVDVVEHTEGPIIQELEPAVPTRTANISFPTACNEPGIHTLSYSVTQLLNGKNIGSPVTKVVSGNEREVTDILTIGNVEYDIKWNPNPVSGMSNVFVSITQPTCGY